MKLLNVKKDWMFKVLVLAGLYNILWGAYVVLLPEHFFSLLEIDPPKYLEFWQCIGMIVGVYGLGYLVAATNPIKHWPIVLVGFLGKIFGPIGFIQAIFINDFPKVFGLNIITNDLIWWIPFFLILKKAWEKNTTSDNLTLTQVELDVMEERYRARLINSLSGFKSSNLIGTIDGEGKTNLCIISSAFHLGAYPPLIGFIIRPDISPRHTLSNLRANKVCTLNHVNQDILDKAHQTSARYAENESEFNATKLTEEFIEGHIAPFVAESRVKLGLEMLREIKLEENGTHFIISKIKTISVPKDTLQTDGFIDIEKAGDYLYLRS